MVLAYARNYAAERQGRWTDEASMQETDLSNHVSDRRAARNRVGPIVILLFVPVLFFSGIPGVHGGGFGTRAALVMSLLSAPVGLLTVIWGLPNRRHSFGWWFSRLYLSACGLALLFAWYDLST